MHQLWCLRVPKSIDERKRDGEICGWFEAGASSFQPSSMDFDNSYPTNLHRACRIALRGSTAMDGWSHKSGSWAALVPDRKGEWKDAASGGLIPTTTIIKKKGGPIFGERPFPFFQIRVKTS